MNRINFNQNWKFQKTGTDQWQVVDLPHDAMIHEIRDPESPGGPAVGFFPGGSYVYEKTFAVPQDWREKHIVFEFEGIYKNSQVYLNGEQAGGRPYGYSHFFVDASRFLRYGEENTIRVVADNSLMPNSRWYSGSGIYRPVYLLVGNKTHIAPDGVQISTLSCAPAKVLVETAANGGEIGIEILDDEKVIATGSGASMEFRIENAKLWSAEKPNLYQCRVTVKDGDVVDQVVENFGIRMVEWSSKGLLINGQETVLRGGCIHHDNGVLGACAYDKAEERRVRIIKEAGFNAIRSSHNPASKALLDACDRYGIYVIDETFDTWYMHKDKYDYATDFNDWYLEDIRAMVEKDFNHPSVIMYSIGNEVAEPYQERGVQITKEMVDYIHHLDRNRAVTGGINLMIIYMASKGRGIYKEEGGRADEGKPPKKKKKQRASGSLYFNMMTSIIGTRMNNMANSNAADNVTSPCLDALDIAGYNYTSGRYAMEGKKHPDRLIYGSETFAHDIAKNWEMVERYPYLIGDFMWTSWDYLGEAGMGAWAYDGTRGFTKPYPWLVAGCGAIDILGKIDAPARYAAVVWGLEKKPYIGVRPVNHPGVRVSKAIWRGTNAINSWAWKNCDGNKAEIEVYADAYKVELFINETSLGRKKIKAFKTLYKTKYVPGMVKAVAYDQNGGKLSESTLVSATGKTSISLKPEETTIQAGELIYVNIHLVGENGVVESNDDRELSVTVEGGTLLGFGSAHPRPEERFDSGSYTTYYGRSLAVVRADQAGELIVRATGVELDPAEVKIAVTDRDPF